MKKLILLYIFCLTCASANSQQLLWERTVGTPYIHPLEYVTLPDGGFAAIYRVNSINAKLVRFDSLGFEVWSHPFATDLRSATFMNAMLKVVPGGLIAGLQKWDSDTVRVALAKVNWQGDEVWTKLVPTGRNGNSACDMHIKSANEYIHMVAGSNSDQTSGDGGGPKFIVISTDSTGNTNWQQTYLDPLQTIDYPRNIIQYRFNGFLFTGNTNTSSSFPRIIKTNQVGNILQNELLSTISASSMYNTSYGNFIQVSDGNVVFTGFNIANNLPDRFLLVSKVDTSLNVLWTVTHNEPGNSFASSNVIEMADSTLLLVSQHLSNINKIILLKISQQGQVLDTTYVSVVNQTHATSLLNAFLLPDSSLIFGGKDFLAKIGNVGLPMPPTVFPPPVGLPEELTNSYSLGLAFPNPAENTVTVPYSLPIGTNKATLRIAEIATGRLVKEVALDLNTETVEVKLDNLSSGLYTYTLLLDGVPSATKKLVVIK